MGKLRKMAALVNKHEAGEEPGWVQQDLPLSALLTCGDNVLSWGCPMHGGCLVALLPLPGGTAGRRCLRMTDAEHCKPEKCAYSLLSLQGEPVGGNKQMVTLPICTPTA